MIYTEVNKYEMIKAFRDYGRLKTSETPQGDFNEEAVELLFDYYEELPAHKLDVIGICCEWTQYDNKKEVQKDYSHSCKIHLHVSDFDGNIHTSATYDTVFEFLDDNTAYFHLHDDSILVRDF